MLKTVKILIADDHQLFRDGLNIQLSTLISDSKVTEAENFTDAIKAVSKEKFDLIIIDLGMPDMEWQEGLGKVIEKKADETRIIVLSASEDFSDIRGTLDLGIAGYIPKRSETKTLLNALKLVIDGGTYLPPAMLQTKNSGCQETKKSIKTSIEKAKLTPRQNQVLQLLSEGLANKQIAYEMGVSEATVKLHINALLKALKVTNRTQAVITAQKMGLL